MCGIAGFFGAGDRRDLAAMMGAIVHRGPDGEGVYVDPDRPLYLGHRRLAVIDVKDGAQPMWDAAGQIGVVYNGEIYNHRELRAELERAGRRFRTDHSDTEVLVHGYAVWGEDLPRRLNGMFAFCIHDRTRNRLFLARDRFGEKPLYYARQAGLFAFASELGAIAAHRGFEARLDPASLQKFFAYGFLPAPNAIYADCRKLPAGEAMSLDLTSGAIRQAPYWRFELTPDAAWLERSEDELAEELRALLIQAVDRRMIADVPLGLFLSGGVDSTALLAAATHVRPHDRLKTFTLGFSEPSFDESAPARAVAEAFGAEHSVQTIDAAAAARELTGVLSRLDEPSADASVLPTSLVARFARRQVTVALSGDGADELFAGYDPFSVLAPAALYRAAMPAPLHRLLRAAAARLPVSGRNMSFDYRLRRTLTGLSHPPALWNPVWLSPVDPKQMREIFLEPLPVESVYAEVLEAWEAAGDRTTVGRTLEFYTRFYLQDGILNKVDRATMLHSLEARAPFLDNDLVAFCQRLPGRFKLRGGRRKYLLKKALAGMAPDFVLKRPKKGFGLPTAAWLKTIPETPPLAPVDGVNMPAVAAAWAEHRRGAADHRQFLWSWLSLQTFGTAADPGVPEPAARDLVQPEALA